MTLAVAHVSQEGGLLRLRAETESSGDRLGHQNRRMYQHDQNRDHPREHPPNRRGEQVADWVHVMASQRREAEFELVDLRDFSLPHLDEPEPAVLGQYQNDHTKAWSEKVACFDGFVMVTPEYNHGSPGVLKNAIDFRYNEWNNKAVGSVSYGGTGGTRAVEQLRLTCGAVMMADIAQQVALSIVTEFENFTVFSRASTTSPPSTRSSIRSSPGAGDSSHFGPRFVV